MENNFQGFQSVRAALFHYNWLMLYQSVHMFVFVEVPDRAAGWL